MEIVSLWIGTRVKVGEKYFCEGKWWKVIKIPSPHEIILIPSTL